MNLLAPSILSANFSNLAQHIRAIEMGGADIIHCDIMDGHFVPNITFGPSIVKAVDEITDLPLDVHLMINNPEKYIEDFRSAGADYISVHQEEVVHLDRTLNYIKSLGAKAGVVLNPATSILLIENILEITDFVLLMSVNPGYGGQSFIEYTLKKIIELNRLRETRNYNFMIEVDGGIDKSNIRRVMEAGCNIFVAGSSIFKKDNVTASTVELKNLIS